MRCAGSTFPLGCLLLLSLNQSIDLRSQLYPKGLELAVRPFAVHDADGAARNELSNLYDRASALDERDKSMSLTKVGLQLKPVLGDYSPEYYALVQPYASPALKRTAVYAPTPHHLCMLLTFGRSVWAIQLQLPVAFRLRGAVVED